MINLSDSTFIEAMSGAAAVLLSVIDSQLGHLNMDGSDYTYTLGDALAMLTVLAGDRYSQLASENPETRLVVYMNAYNGFRAMAALCEAKANIPEAFKEEVDKHVTKESAKAEEGVDNDNVPPGKLLN